MKEKLRNSLYGVLLHKLAERFSISEPELCARLKPHMYDIRERYRSGNVAISYQHEEVVAAYLLTYLPNYALLTCAALENLPLHHSANLDAVAFCGGPLPELLGLAALLERPPQREHRALSLRNVDLYANDWEWAMLLSQDITRRFAPALRTQVSAARLNLKELWPPKTVAALQGASLYLFQNCWNEMYNETALSNLRSIADTASDGTLFCFIDQTNYPKNQEAFKAVKADLAAAGCSLIEDNSWKFEPDLVCPNRIRNEFFDGNLRAGNPPTDRWHLAKKYLVSSLILRKDG